MKVLPGLSQKELLSCGIVHVSVFVKYNELCGAVTVFRDMG